MTPDCLLLHLCLQQLLPPSAQGAELMLVTFLLTMTKELTEAASGRKDLFGLKVKGDVGCHDRKGVAAGLALSGATGATDPVWYKSHRQCGPQEPQTP